MSYRTDVDTEEITSIRAHGCKEVRDRSGSFRYFISRCCQLVIMQLSVLRVHDVPLTTTAFGAN
jgi:hypothetical protein